MKNLNSISLNCLRYHQIACATLMAFVAVFAISGCGNDRQTLTPPANTSPLATAEKPAAEEIVADAHKFLLSKQAADGAWKSETYGLLKSGQALTPFVLYSLVESGLEIPAAHVESALSFLRSKTRDGAIGMDDEMVLEYPVYSTAYALMCFKQLGNAKDKKLISQMQDYLVKQQFTEANGFDASHPAYGGWGFGGDQEPGETGHMDLAHTRRVIEALAMTPRYDKMQEVTEKANLFLRMVQKHPDDDRPQPMPPELGDKVYAKVGFDGGFYFSPVVLRANKGRLVDTEPPFWKSYATATCEGLLALLATGATEEDMRVSAATEWLEDQHELEYPQGIPVFYEGENWRDAVHFYHLSVRGEVRRNCHSVENREAIIDAMLSFRLPNGSFSNSKSNLMKEDDPLMCTALAVLALAD